MIINYDRQVLKRAQRIASAEGATQRDLAVFIHDVHHTWLSYNVPYMAPEVYDQIVKLQRSLPRRRTR